MAERAEAAAAAAAPEQPQHEAQRGRRAAGLRRLLWLLPLAAGGCLLVASPRFLQDLDQQLSQRADDRGSPECLQEDDCSSRDSSECGREQCLLAASRIRTMLNAAADPCSNFYEFACGLWSEPNSKIAPSFNTLQQHVNLEIQMLLFKQAKQLRGPFEKLGRFYSSCLDSYSQQQSETPLFELLDRLGGFTQRSDSHRVNLTKTIGAVLKLNGAPLFDVYVDSDVGRKNKLAIYLDLPQRTNAFVRLLKYDRVFQLWQRLLLEQYEPVGRMRREEKRKAFNYIKASAVEKKLLRMEKLAQQFVPQSTPNRTSEVQQILLFASLLTQIYPEEKDVAGKLQARHKIPIFSVGQLQHKFAFTTVQWRSLIEEVFGFNVSDATPVYVVAESYMNRLINLSSRFDKSVVHNGLLLLFARDYLQELVDPSVVSNWDLYCTKTTINFFPGAVSALYVRQYSQDFLEELQVRVTDLFEKLKLALLARIEASRWLDAQSQAAAAEKLAALTGHFFTWPHFWNDSYVDAVMNEIEVGEDGFFWNVVTRMKQLRRFNGSLDEHHSHEKRWAYPFVVNAFYEQSINSIVIPLAVLTEPYFQQDMPRYIPYGTMGLIFTHEILHAFDLIGIQYNGRGENAPWLSQNSREEFHKRLECVAGQYRNAFVRKVDFMGNQINVEFDWNVTLNENMADISGLHVAYEAWRREQLHGGYSDQTLPDVNLNKEQLFFVSAAQTYCSSLGPEDYIVLVELDFHTPFPERVNGIMMNSEEFANAFQCPLGTPMNPEAKCFIW